MMGYNNNFIFSGKCLKDMVNKEDINLLSFILSSTNIQPVIFRADSIFFLQYIKSWSSIILACSMFSIDKSQDDKVSQLLNC